MKSGFLFFFLVLSFGVYSQTSIESSYNAVYNGRNVNLSVKQNFKKLALSAGLKYHINRPEMVPYGSFFKNSATATNFAEHIGLQIGVDYFFYQNQFCKIGAFYNNQFSRMAETHQTYDVIGQLIGAAEGEGFVYIKTVKIFGPVLASDNSIGVVLKTNFTPKIYSVLRGGFGMMFWKNTDSSVLLFSSPHQHGYNFTSFGSVGFGYKFAKREKKEKGKS